MVDLELELMHLKKPVSKAAKLALPGNKAVSIKELPEEVKSKLPELKMTVHSYDERSQSKFVVVNSRTGPGGSAD